MYQCINNAELEGQDITPTINDDGKIIGDIISNYWLPDLLEKIKKSKEEKSTDGKTFCYYTRLVNSHLEVGIAEVKFIQ